LGGKKERIIMGFIDERIKKVKRKTDIYYKAIFQVSPNLTPPQISQNGQYPTKFRPLPEMGLSVHRSGGAPN